MTNVSKKNRIFYVYLRTRSNKLTFRLLHAKTRTEMKTEKLSFTESGTLTIKKVETKKDLNDFIQFPKKLYAKCPYYVTDLDRDIRNMFNPKKNAGLDFSEIQAFLAYDKQGKVMGRIVGIINHHANEKWETKNLRFGYFDFIDDIAVSKHLLNAVSQWGKDH
jgi:hypothetical protein